MTKTKKYLLSFLILLIPFSLMADEGAPKTSGLSFWQLLLTPKYIAIFIVSIIGIILLFLNQFNTRNRTIFLLFTFITFGVVTIFFHVLFLSPSPVCATTKPFIYGPKPPFFATILVIGVLSIIATKGFCGNACPVGALQELLYRIPILKKIKRNRIPFKVSNSIRIFLAILFIIIAFAFGTSIYYYINLFDLIHWEFDMPLLELVEFIVFTLLILFLSMIFFRPFCYLICPMGLFTWILEQFSIMKVRVKKDTCDMCGACEIASPCPAIKDIVNNKKIKADCHLCGICLDSCSKNAIYFGTK